MTSCCVAEHTTPNDHYVLLSPRSFEPKVDLTVAEKRRALALLRRGWEEVHMSRRQKPMYLSSSLGLSNAPHLSFEDFALRFVLLHHSKRSTTAPTEAVEDSEAAAQAAEDDLELEKTSASPAQARVASAGVKKTAPCR